MSHYLESADEPEAALDESTVALDAPESDNPDEQGDAAAPKPYGYY